MGLRPEHAPRQRDPPSLPSWSSVSARLCSCPVTSGVLGHPELQKLKLKSNLCRSCLAPLTRQNVSARASVARQQWLELREEPPVPNAGSCGPRGRAALHGGPLAFQAGAGPLQAKLQWLSRGCLSGSRQRLTCPAWAVARTRPLDSHRVAVVPDGSQVHRPSRGQLEAGSDRPQPGLGDPKLRAGARDSAGLSLPCRRQSQPCSRLPPARGSREPPGYRSRRGGSAWLRRPGPSAAVPEPSPPRLCGAERSWAERGARCSLAFRKATLAAGRRDAGLTHERTRVNARLPGCV